MELIQWLIILALGGAVAFLWKERHENRVPTWLRELQQDDWITRAELDQYQLQVIQMSQAQRDLMNARFDELGRSASTPEVEMVTPPQESPVPAIEPVSTLPSPPPSISSPVIEESSQQVSCEEVKMESATPIPVEGPVEMDAPSRAISLFREGKTIEQIAQELRIGRQEAQLLIRMAQHKSSSFAGV